MPSTHTASSQSITAVILAGGASSRMGRDKALLEWRGQTFIAHVIDRLRQQVDHIAINTNNAEGFAHFALPIVSDSTDERRGPLAGIQAALQFNRSELTLIVPCDNPQISPELVSRLLAALEREDADLAYACSNGDSHYLYALMYTNLRDRLTVFLKQRDFAVRHWYATLRTARVDFSDAAEYFRNLNAPEDLQRLLDR